MDNWWLTYSSGKYEFVSWDDEIPNWMEKSKNVPNHQPEMLGLKNGKYWDFVLGDHGRIGLGFYHISSHEIPVSEYSFPCCGIITTKPGNIVTSPFFTTNQHWYVQ